MAGTLFVVATPIGNLEDISARALRVLGEVALIAAEDTRRTAQLLARYGIATQTTSLHEHNEQRKAPALIARLLAGEDVALVSDAGTPAISDPGAALVRDAAARGITILPIPGPSAISAALSVAGLDESRYLFLGFPPTKGAAREAWMKDAASVSIPLVFFESPHRIRFTLTELQTALGDVRVLICRESTKKHEEYLRGSLSEVVERLRDTPIGEFTVVIEGDRPTTVAHQESLSPQQLLHEFSHLTVNGGLTRRQAVSALARKYHLSGKAVYSAIEDGKSSGS